MFQRVPTKRGKSSDPTSKEDGPTSEKKSKMSDDEDDDDDDGHDSEGEGVEEINDEDE